jgi:hypothetical protein
MSTEQANQPSEAVRLNYIDKAYNTLSAFWRLRGHLALAVGALSLILLAIATGVASPGAQDVSLHLAGLELKLPLASFLVVGAGVLAALVVALYAVLFRSDCIYLEIRTLYEDGLKYEPASMRDPLRNPFHSVTFYGALRASWLSDEWRSKQFFIARDPRVPLNVRVAAALVLAYDWLTAHGVAYVFVVGLPIASEGWILWKLATTVHWRQNWIAALLTVALCALSLIVTISAIIRYHYLRKKR